MSLKTTQDKGESKENFKKGESTWKTKSEHSKKLKHCKE